MDLEVLRTAEFKYNYVRGSLHINRQGASLDADITKFIVHSDFNIMVLGRAGARKIKDAPSAFFAALPRDILLNWLHYGLFKYELAHFRRRIHDWFIGVRDPAAYVLRTLNYGIALRDNHFIFVTMDDPMCTLNSMASVALPLTVTEFFGFVAAFETEYVFPKEVWISKIIEKYPKRAAQFRKGRSELTGKVADVRALGVNVLLGGVSPDAVAFIAHVDAAADEDKKKQHSDCAQ